MATVVDEAEKLAKHVRAMSIDARRIRFAPITAAPGKKPKPEIDRIDFRRQGV